MAALRYKDARNKVVYLLKPTGSDNYHQIIEFLSASHIRAHEFGPSAILATIDKTPYTITEDLTQLCGASYATFTYYASSSSSRPQPSDPIAPVLEHDQSSYLHTASFFQAPETDVGPFTTMEDEPIGSDFYTSPPRSSHAPPAGQPLGVGKLIKKVKTLEVKLKTKKRKLVVSDSNQEDGDTQHVDLDALHALANAAVTVDSDIPSGGSLQIPAASLSVPTVGPPGTSSVLHSPSVVPPSPSDVPTGASTVPAGSLTVPTNASSHAAPTGVSSKGKSLMVEEDIPVKARTFKHMEEDRLGGEAAKRLHDEEIALMERERAEVAQVEANASLSKTLLGDDVSEDNFSARMAALIKKNRTNKLKDPSMDFY
nr:JmjC domain-containing protein [Tanacetum cinerariifolium]